MQHVIDLHVSIAQPASGSPRTARHLHLSCPALGWAAQGAEFTDPLTDKERSDLSWYLEESWRWPFEGFAERASQIEQTLTAIGRRLFQVLLHGLSQDAVRHFDRWHLQAAEPGWRGQITIVSDIPWVHSLPWELLHDGLGFLVLRTGAPIAVIRRFSTTPPANLLRPMTLPLRVLLVIARPDDTGFVDPRGIAGKLFDAIEPEILAGRIALEVLRPPSLRALRERLADHKAPVHVVHFDGHGMFAEHPERLHRAEEAAMAAGSGQGMLVFEDGQARKEPVSADTLGNILQASGVQLALLNACQSAVSSENDVFSSVSGRLIQGGLNAVIAMSASVLVVSAARYVAAFYTALAHAQSVTVAHEQARQSLHDDQRRHLISRTADAAGSFVRLQDWWLPHYYEQRQLTLTFAPSPGADDTRAAQAVRPIMRDLPVRSVYGFFGRKRELLTVERALMASKCVVLSGMIGVGKTALACEAAEWLTRTGMFMQVCYISLERGGDAIALCSSIAKLLDPDGEHEVSNTRTVAELTALVGGRPTLLIVDDIDTVLPEGRFALEAGELTRLWDALLAFRAQGVGLMLLSRSPELGDVRLAQGPQTSVLRLGGLELDAGIEFAVALLAHHAITPQGLQHDQLCALLRRLQQHPQAIMLILPALAAKPLPSLRTSIEELMAASVGAETENDSQIMLPVIEWALCQLSESQRQLLQRLSVFVGGPSEVIVGLVTQIERNDWVRLRTRLEQLALVQVERLPGVNEPAFLRLHPLLVPYLRSRNSSISEELRERYLTSYIDLADYLYKQDVQYPQQARTIARRELPDLLNSYELLLQQNDLERASLLAHVLTKFLSNLGLISERERVIARLAAAQPNAQFTTSDDTSESQTAARTLTEAGFLSEYGLAEESYQRGEFNRAIERCRRLLERIERLQPEIGVEKESATRRLLALTLRDAGDLDGARQELDVALGANQSLLGKDPQQRQAALARLTLLSDLATVLSKAQNLQGAAQSLAEAARLLSALDEVRGQPVQLEQQAGLLMRQNRFDDAQSLYEAAYREYLTLDAPVQAARVRNQLAKIAWRRQYQLPAQQRDWTTAEQHYREALAVFERYGAWREAGVVSRSLTAIAAEAGRVQEAQRWGLRAVELFASTNPGGRDQINALEYLSYSLIFALRDGDIPRERIELADRYAQEALSLSQANPEQFGNWRIYRTVALIARLRGDIPGERAYLQQERNFFLQSTDSTANLAAASKSAAMVVAGALGDYRARETVALALLDLPSIEDGLARLDAFEQIWAGERDYALLVRNLGGPAAQCVQEVLRQLRDAELSDNESNV